MIQFGRIKRYSEITIDDCIRNPVWTSAHDAKHDEESAKPIINCDEVTDEIVTHPLIVPIITVRIRDSELHGSGWYLHGERKLFAISIWCEGEWKSLSDVSNLIRPILLISLPAILGERDVAFVCSDPESEIAFRSHH